MALLMPSQQHDPSAYNGVINGSNINSNNAMVNQTNGGGPSEQVHPFYKSTLLPEFPKLPNKKKHLKIS